MKVIVAVDSFKGSLTSLEAGNAVKAGILRAAAHAKVQVLPLADGGEGTVLALTLQTGGRMERAVVTGPLGEPVECAYGILTDNTAVIEIAGAAGLTLVRGKERNPLFTTTYGVGQVIQSALQKGCRRFLVGLGGSATNDGGIGMLQALGFGMLNADGEQVSLGAKGLQELAQITNDNVLPQLKECTFTIACDVTNPLCGPQGASAVFAPQKGGAADIIPLLDEWLSAYAQLAAKHYANADPNACGAGAAGGLGFAFVTFLGATLKSGAQTVLEETGAEALIKDADVVVTGEGRLDGQSLMGKAPVALARIAKKYKKPVIAFCGSAGGGADLCLDAGIDAYFPITREGIPLEEAMKPEVATNNLTNTVEQVFRQIQSIKRK